MKTLFPSILGKRFPSNISPKFRSGSALVVALLMAGVSAQAAPKGKATAEESAPQLMSRTGGAGATWSNLAELETAAKTNNPKAWTQLGELRLKGDQTPQDVRGGIELLEKAANAGEASAAFSLGKVYDDGVLAPADRPRAHDYYRAAAAGKVPEAFFNLGAAYSSGRGVKRDYAEGLAWLILARKAGIENDGEQRLRERLTSQRRADLIQKGERRADEIEVELAEKKVAGLLPGATTAPAARPVAERPSAPKATQPSTTIPLDRGQAAPPPPSIPRPAEIAPPALSL